MYLRQTTIFLSLFLIVSGKLTLEKVVDPVLHGEGPHWDSDQQVLYYVDISNQTISKYDPKTKEVTRVYVEGGPIGFVVPDRHDNTKFVLGRGLDLVSIKWDGRSPKPSSLNVLASVDGDKPENRFNDGKVDSMGRLWAGTMGPENPDIRLHQGSLFSFDRSDKFQPHKHLSPVSISNGIAWNDKDDVMYYIDSPTRAITSFDFDKTTGKISNQRVVFSLEKNNITGFPDGMTIDRDGNLWVAVFRGNCVLHIDTEGGKLIEKINLPVSQVTSCAFGGSDLSDLYVTSSRLHLSEEDVRNEPLAGALFKVSGLNVLGQIKPSKILT